MIPRCSCLPAARPVAVPYRETASAQGCISKKWVRLVRTHTIFSLVPQHISRCEAHFTSPSGRTSFAKKNHTISRVLFFVLALPIFLGRAKDCPAGGRTRASLLYKYKKTDLPVASQFFMLALPIFPCSHPQSIVGEGELNFCVRDGNRWTLTPINTNSSEQTSYPSPRPKVQGSLIPLFLLSKSQPLRWVAILSGHWMYPEN